MGRFSGIFGNRGEEDKKKQDQALQEVQNNNGTSRLTFKPGFLKAQNESRGVQEQAQQHQKNLVDTNQVLTQAQKDTADATSQGLTYDQFIQRKDTMANGEPLAKVFQAAQDFASGFSKGLGDLKANTLDKISLGPNTNTAQTTGRAGQDSINPDTGETGTYRNGVFYKTGDILPTNAPLSGTTSAPLKAFLDEVNFAQQNNYNNYVLSATKKFSENQNLKANLVLDQTPEAQDKLNKINFEDGLLKITSSKDAYDPKFLLDYERGVINSATVKDKVASITDFNQLQKDVQSYKSSPETRVELDKKYGAELIDDLSKNSDAYLAGMFIPYYDPELTSFPESLKKVVASLPADVFTGETTGEKIGNGIYEIRKTISDAFTKNAELASKQSQGLSDMGLPAFKSINETLDAFNNSLAGGITGGLIKPQDSADPGLASTKIAQFAGNLTGTLALNHFVSTKLDGVIKGNPTALDFAAKYPTAYGMILNAGVFGTTGQIDPDTKDRLGKFSKDVLMSVPYSMVGTKAKYDFAPGYILGYASAKLDGADDGTAFTMGALNAAGDYFFGKSNRDALEKNTVDNLLKLKQQGAEVYNKATGSKLTVASTPEDVVFAYQKANAELYNKYGEGVLPTKLTPESTQQEFKDAYAKLATNKTFIEEVQKLDTATSLVIATAGTEWDKVNKKLVDAGTRDKTQQQLVDGVFSDLQNPNKNTEVTPQLNETVSINGKPVNPKDIVTQDLNNIVKPVENTNVVQPIAPTGENGLNVAPVTQTPTVSNVVTNQVENIPPVDNTEKGKFNLQSNYSTISDYKTAVNDLKTNITDYVGDVTNINTKVSDVPKTQDTIEFNYKDRNVQVGIGKYDNNGQTGVSQLEVRIAKDVNNKFDYLATKSLSPDSSVEAIGTFIKDTIDNVQQIPTYSEAKKLIPKEGGFANIHSLPAKNAYAAEQLASSLGLNEKYLYNEATKQSINLETYLKELDSKTTPEERIAVGTKLMSDLNTPSQQVPDVGKVSTLPNIEELKIEAKKYDSADAFIKAVAPDVKILDRSKYSDIWKEVNPKPMEVKVPQRVKTPEQVISDAVFHFVNKKGTNLENKQLYRGTTAAKIAGEDSGGADLGQGLYFTTSKKVAKQYGDVVNIDSSNLPKNPLVFDTRTKFDGFLAELKKMAGIKSEADVGDLGKLIRTAGNYDGVVIGDGEIIVKYSTADKIDLPKANQLPDIKQFKPVEKIVVPEGVPQALDKLVKLIRDKEFKTPEELINFLDEQKSKVKISDQDINTVKIEISNALQDVGLDAEAVDLIPFGSMTTGAYNSKSDADFLLEFSGTAKEDQVFNAIYSHLKDSKLKINDRKIDVFPINPEETGTIDEFLKEQIKFTGSKEGLTDLFNKVNTPVKKTRASVNKVIPKLDYEIRDAYFQNDVLLAKEHNPEARTALGIREDLLRKKFNEYVYSHSEDILGSKDSRYIRLKIVPFSDGKYSIQYDVGLIDRGTGTPFMGVYENRKEAIAQVLVNAKGWLERELKRNDMSKTLITQANKYISEIDKVAKDQGVILDMNKSAFTDKPQVSETEQTKKLKAEYNAIDEKAQDAYIKFWKNNPTAQAIESNNTPMAFITSDEVNKLNELSSLIEKSKQSDRGINTNEDLKAIVELKRKARSLGLNFDNNVSISELETLIKDNTSSTKKSFSVGADYGGYSDLATQSIEHNVINTPPLKLPELVSLFKNLTGHEISLTQRFKKAIGMAYKQTLDIKLSRDIFANNENTKLVERVLAHEIGHIMDYLPDKAPRGNIVGRILTLNNFTKSTFGELKNSKLKAELKAFTQFWKPFDDTLDAGFTKYRYSPSELYADAISGLLIDPLLFKQKAPLFYEAFLNNVDAKPEVKQALLDTYDTLNKGEESLMEQRLANKYKDYEEGKKKREEIEATKPIEKTAVQNFERNFVSSFSPVYEKINKALKDKAITLSDSALLKDQLQGLNYTENAIWDYGRKIAFEVVKPLENVGITERQIGVILDLESNLGARKDIANPGGFTPEYSKETLDYIKNKLTDVQKKVLGEVMKSFRDLNYSIAKEAADVGRYSQEVLKTIIEPNKDSYISHGVIQYIEKNYVTAQIIEAKGTLKAIENPIVTSLFKNFEVIKAIEKQKTKTAVVEFMKNSFADEISPAVAIRDSTGRFIKWVDKTNLGVLDLFEDGKFVGYYVDPYIAEVFTKLDTTEAAQAIKIIKEFNNVFKHLVTSWNIAWALFSNPTKDMRRTFKNMSASLAKYNQGGQQFGVLNLPEFLASWIKSIPEGARFAKGDLTDLTTEMLRVKAMSIPFAEYDANANNSADIAPALRKAKLLANETKQSALKKVLNVTQLPKIFNLLEFVGSTFEGTTKISGYQLVKKRVKSAQMAGFITRNYVGTPNFKERGNLTNLSNELFVFSNVMIQGMKADAELASSPNSRGAFWLQTFLLDMLPKLLMVLAAGGLLGEGIKDQFAGMTEYDKTNYLTIPMGIDENGKTIYMRVPQDETGRFFSALVWKLGSAMNNDLKKPEQVATLGTSFLPSQTPLFDVIGSWLDFIQNRNPYDSFRGRVAIAPKVFKEGGLPAVTALIKYNLNQVGISAFNTYDDSNVSTTESTLSNIPVIQRMIRVSDYGKTETDQAKQDAQEQADSAVVRDYIQKFSNSADQTEYNRSQMAQELIDKVVGPDITSSEEKSKATSLNTEFLKGIAKEQNDPLTNRLLSKTKNEDKAKELFDSLQGQSYFDIQDTLDRLLSLKVISKDVIDKYNTLAGGQ